MEPAHAVTVTEALDGAAAPAAHANAARPWFPCLNGLRALAALAVVVFHVTNSVAPFVSKVSTGGEVVEGWVGGAVLARLGNWGVAIFFALSGFLLYRPFVSAWFEGRRHSALRPYLTRRLVRIVPAYWLALTVLLVFIRTSAPTEGWRTAAYLYGFAQIYRSDYVTGGGSLSVAWTLCIEMTFYLALPALAWGLRRLSPSHLALAARVRAQVAAVLLLSVAATVFRWWVIKSHPLQTYWLPAHFAWFGLGMALAVIHAGSSGGVTVPSVLRVLGRYPALSWLFALQILWLTSRITVRPWIQTRSELLWIFVGNALSATLLLVPMVFGDQSSGLLRSLLDSRPVQWLGELSYGIYLWHTIWLALVLRWISNGEIASATPYRLVVVTVLTLAASQLSYLLVERPLLMVVHGRRPRLGRHRAQADRQQ